MARIRGGSRSRLEVFETPAQRFGLLLGPRQLGLEASAFRPDGRPELAGDPLELLAELRRLRREGPRQAVSVVSADPLNFQGILTPEKRTAPTEDRHVLVG